MGLDVSIRSSRNRPQCWVSAEVDNIVFLTSMSNFNGPPG